MAKSKSTTTSGSQKSESNKTAPTNVFPEPTNVKVGLPHVPSGYGLKPRKQYLPWSHAQERLERSRNYWICTSRPDGRPHSIPVWGFFLDDVLYFGTMKSSRKAKNLDNNPSVSIHLDSGDDVVIVEGEAREIPQSNKEVFSRLDAASKAKYKMPLVVEPGAVLFGITGYVLARKGVLATDWLTFSASPATH